MQKINFENYPSTNSPINATNLNTIQTNVENEFLVEDDKIYYKDGDTFSPINNGIVCAGFLTTSKQDVFFSMPVNKSMKNISSVTINRLQATIRHADGGYIANNVQLSTLGTLSIAKSSDYFVTIKLILSTASQYTNNSTLSVLVQANTQLTFNE